MNIRVFVLACMILLAATPIALAQRGTTGGARTGSGPTIPLPNTGGLGSTGSPTGSLIAPSLKSTLPNVAAPTFRQVAPAQATQRPAARAARRATSKPNRYALLSAYTRRAGRIGCNIYRARFASCNGRRCSLSCAHSSCPGSPPNDCEFQVRCLAEIAAEVISGEPLCRDVYITRSVIQSGRRFKIQRIKIKVGQTCRPPPCL